MQVRIKTMTGTELLADMPESATGRDLQAWLTAQGGMGPCMLFLHRQKLKPSMRLLDCNIQPGSFVTAIPLTGEDKKKAVAAAARKAAANAAGPGAVASAGAASASGTGAVAQAGPKDASNNPQQATGGSATTAGPYMSSLLPGYLSRPNPSPINSPVKQQQQRRLHGAEGPPVHKDMAGNAAGGVQGVDLHTAGGLQHAAASPGVKQGATLLQQHQLLQERLQQQQQMPHELKQQPNQAFDALWSELTAELQQAPVLAASVEPTPPAKRRRLKQQQQQHAEEQDSTVQHLPQLHDDGAPADAAQTVVGAAAGSSGAAPATTGGEAPPDTTSSQPNSNIHAKRSPAKKGKRGQAAGKQQPPQRPFEQRVPQHDITRSEANALAVLQLPPCLERLAAVFRSLNGLVGFLRQQHITPTWRTTREHLWATLPQESVTLADLEAMAALVPQCFMLVPPVAVADPDDSSTAVGLQSAQVAAAEANQGHDYEQLGGFVTEGQQWAADAGFGVWPVGEPVSQQQQQHGEGEQQWPAMFPHSSILAQGWDSRVAEQAASVTTRDALNFWEGPGAPPASQQGDMASYAIELPTPGRFMPVPAQAPPSLPLPAAAPSTAPVAMTGAAAGMAATNTADGIASAPADAAVSHAPAVDLAPSDTADQAITGMTEAGEGDDAPAEPAKARRGGITAVQRRAAAFRNGLALAVWLLHKQFLQQLPQQPAVPATAVTDADGKSAQEEVQRAHNEPQQQQQESSRLTRAKRRRTDSTGYTTHEPDVGNLTAAASTMPVASKGRGRSKGNRGRSPKPRRQSKRTTSNGQMAEEQKAAPDAAQAPGASDTSSSDWDPLVKAAWHPSFDVSAVTLADAIAAAKAHQQQLKQQHQQELQQARLDENNGLPSALGAPVEAGAGNGSGRPARPPNMMKRHPPCGDMRTLDPQAFLEHLKELPWYKQQIAHVHHTPARDAIHVAPRTPLSAPVQAALASRGITQPFSHQAQAINALLAGQHTVVATSTASGKSLCYLVPVLEALAADATACALFMFPTKALAQDQLRALRDLCEAAFGERAPCAEVYDGDTPRAERAGVRERAQLLITNPDMLHVSILPIHASFSRLLTNLRYVVVDEGHAYKGVFGCHTALVLRRLRRLCLHAYNCVPRFVVTSATIANPLQHTQVLLGLEDIHVVDQDGSPHGPTDFVLWNPPLTFGAAQDAKASTKAEMSAQLLEGADPSEQVRESKPKRGAQKMREREAKRVQLREANAARRRGAALGRVSETDWLHQVRASKKVGALKADLWGSPGKRNTQQAKAWDQLTVLDSDGGQQLEDNQTLGLQATELLSVEHGAAADAPASSSAAPAVAGVITMAETEGPGSGADAGHEQRGVDTAAARQALAQQALAAISAVGALPADGVLAARPDQHTQRRRIWSVRSSGVGAPAASKGVPESVQRAIQDTLPSPEAFTSNDGGQGNGVTVAPPNKYKGRYGATGATEDVARDSPIVEISLVLAEAVQHGLRTIAFCKTRKLSELVGAYTREVLAASAPHLIGRLKVYRGGYSPAERRAIETALHGGAITAVAATNALELGIDIGSLDLTLHLGFPGSVASLRQQAGRAGRREQRSLSIYVGFDGPLDQHFMRHPVELFERSVECAQIDPWNHIALQQHAACAAAELPLDMTVDGRFFGEAALAKAVSALVAAGQLGRHPRSLNLNTFHYTGPLESPGAQVSLRAIDQERFVIHNDADGKVLEEVEASKAFYQVYDGAVYMCQGRTYLCKRLDLDSRVAVVRPTDVHYYTSIQDYKDVHVTGGRVAYPTASVALAALAARRGDRAAAAAAASTLRQGQGQQCCHGSHGSAVHADVHVPVTSATCESCVVTVRFMGYHRVRKGSGEAFDHVQLFLPDVQMETQAAYLRLPLSARAACTAAGLPFREGVHAASHALLNVLPLFMLCNRGDVGTECDNPYDTRYRPERLLLYDTHPGGTGLVAQATPLFPELLRRALALVEECPCAPTDGKGCPGCIQHMECSNYNVVLSKEAAKLVLKAALEQEMGQAVDHSNAAVVADAAAGHEDGMAAAAGMAAVAAVPYAAAQVAVLAAGDEEMLNNILQ